jgi:alkyldihydroxyacetonephosphate synthase
MATRKALQYPAVVMLVPFRARPTAATSETLEERLREALGEHSVQFDEGERRAVASDRWTYRSVGLAQGEDPLRPAVVVRPADEGEIQATLEIAGELGVPVVPQGAGSGVVGGASCWGGEIVLDLKRMRRILELNAEDMSVRVEAGLLGQRLEDALAARGLMLGHVPASIRCSTVGGWLAARSAGQLSSRFGKIEDQVLSLRLATPGVGVLDSRELMGSVPVLLGSEGCLGVITEATLRVHPAPEHIELRGFRFLNLDLALDACRQLMAGGTEPSVLRIYDPLDTRIAMAAHEGREGGAYGELSGLLRSEDRTTLARALVARPRLLRRARSLLGRSCLVVVGYQGRQEEALERMLHVGRAWRTAARDLGPGPGRTWFERRHSVSFHLPRLLQAGLFADTLEVACRWSTMPELYRRLMATLSTESLPMAHFSHAYVEGVAAYFSFVGRGATLEETRARYLRLWAAAMEVVTELGVSCTHHHGVGVLKRAEATREAGAALTGWSSLKRWVDPSGVLNPGVLFEGWAGDPRSGSSDS